MVQRSDQTGMERIRKTTLFLAIIAVASPSVAEAYIGPGAGFAVLGSFAVLFVTMILAGVSILAWPFRMLWRAIRRRTKSTPLVRRLIVVGFDGQEPSITERMMAEGKLPNFQKLADSGCYSRLRSTFPSITPVAWSTATHEPICRDCRRPKSARWTEFSSSVN
jgi:hypothetical protein